ncbi:hypothetical protein N7457_008766 [Penicillium paradoxum]|uniref:uncharacterized protein n=1 Tax=Penicillium paradoxum TaxID=176176 RepID=UPI002549085D|nr:uncharacterized protein N7457_008766 [Penicillium paradoxum]KAJ5773870.1 hypothetical protein N7457_008766 [Penicillium paradoxum]
MMASIISRKQRHYPKLSAHTLWVSGVQEISHITHVVTTDWMRFRAPAEIEATGRADWGLPDDSATPDEIHFLQINNEW